MTLVKQFPFWGPPDMEPPKVWDDLWDRAMKYANERAEDENEHDDDKICGWWEREYELLCDAAGVEAYTYN